MTPQLSSKDRLLLLTAPFDHPHRDLVAATLGWMAQVKGVQFDAYYTAKRRDGGIFSPFGSGVLGGRHHASVAHALAKYETTLIQLGKIHALSTLLEDGGCRTLPSQASLVDTYLDLTRELAILFPKSVVAYQTHNLPQALTHELCWLDKINGHYRLTPDPAFERQPSLVQYACWEALSRQALAFPLECEPADIARLSTLGVNEVYTVAVPGADARSWSDAGLTVHFAEALSTQDTLHAFSFRQARKWQAGLTGFDLCEPILAAYWLPFAIRERRGMVAGEVMKAAACDLVELARSKGQTTIYGRYGGGALRGATSDKDLFPLFEQDIAFEVVEPGRPVLTVLSSRPTRLPQPDLTPFDLEPSDDELRAWLREGRIPTTLVFHSGEMSHNDGAYAVMDLCAATGVKVGLGIHYQRYLFEPEAVEAMQTPVSEGGALGLCEPVLHSAGNGILAECLGHPAEIARLMAEARERIASITGRGFAPLGVYPYFDAFEDDWQKPNDTLWAEIEKQGFSYVVSSVCPGESRVLSSGNCLVLSQTGLVTYPYSPFVRINNGADLLKAEQAIIDSGKPGWILPVLDTPVYASSMYLSVGDPFGLTGGLGQFFDPIMKGGASGRLVSATPHTIARFARLVASQ